MTDVQTIRTIIADQIRYDRSAATGDGLTTDFQVANAPVVAASQKVYIDGTLRTEGTDYTFDGALGLCAFQSPPGDALAVVITYQYSILSDAQIQALLDLEGDVFAGAAACLESIAASEVLVQKRITLMDLQTDGPAEARELRALAEALRGRSDGLAGDGAGFDFAEMVETEFQVRERLTKERLRNLI